MYKCSIRQPYKWALLSTQEQDINKDTLMEDEIQVIEIHMYTYVNIFHRTTKYFIKF